jgi:hypothetical protein
MQRALSVNIPIVLTIVAALHSLIIADSTAGVQARASALRRRCVLLVEEGRRFHGTRWNRKRARIVSPRAGGPGITASSCEHRGSGVQTVNLNLMQMPAHQAAIYKALCAQKGNDGLTALGEVAYWYDDKHEELQAQRSITNPKSLNARSAVCPKNKSLISDKCCGPVPHQHA